VRKSGKAKRRNMLRIALCDDHPLIREGMKRILLAHSDIRVEVEAGTGAELLAAADAHRLDVVILDVSLPDMSGLDVLKNLRAAQKPVKVLVLSMHPEEQYASRVLRAGADGYLQKESVPAELEKAVRHVARGGKYITPTLAEHLATDLTGNAAKDPHELLSDREYEVLCLLAGGKSVKEIAGMLSISPPTVATYRARLLEKLGLATTVDLVRYALDNGLVE
jgi:two-component system, NarL family, invasion response regulator UvrY